MLVQGRRAAGLLLELWRGESWEQRQPRYNKMGFGPVRSKVSVVCTRGVEGKGTRQDKTREMLQCNAHTKAIRAQAGDTAVLSPQLRIVRVRIAENFRESLDLFRSIDTIRTPAVSRLGLGLGFGTPPRHAGKKAAGRQPEPTSGREQRPWAAETETETDRE